MLLLKALQADEPPIRDLVSGYVHLCNNMLTASASTVGYDGANRRSSYYGTPSSPYSPNGRAPPTRSGQGGYYRSSSYNYRPDNFAEEGPQQYQQGAPPPRHMRYPSAPYHSNQDSPTSMHSHQQSYDTMTSGSDEMSKSTNPSSQNSSFDQLHQANVRKPEDYAANSHRQNGQMRNPYPPSAMNNGRMNGYMNGHTNGYANGYATDEYGHEFNSRPAPPPKQLIKFSSVNGEPPAESGWSAGSNVNSKPEKRQSWIKRTFSKRS